MSVSISEPWCCEVALSPIIIKGGGMKSFGTTALTQTEHHPPTPLHIIS